MQAPVETANHGLSEDSASPAGSSASSPPAPATPTPGPAPAPPPEQSASSVRELESAMSRHLPEPKKLRTSEMTDPASAASAASATSHLLKQFYSGSASSYPGLSLGPAQPVALKPSLYLDQFPDQPPGPGLYPGQPLHSLYQRGHSWYPGT